MQLKTDLSRMPKAHFQCGKSLGCFPIVGLLLLTIIVTVGATVWVIQSQLFAKDFKPVELSQSEQLTLEQKLDALANFEEGNFEETSLEETPSSEFNDNNSTAEQIADSIGSSGTNLSDEGTQSGELQPELYSEDDSKRRIELSERELNSLLAKNTDLAEQLVVHLSQDQASIKLLIDLDPDFPFFGGKTLKVSGATQLSYNDDRPVVIMQGVSVWGVPIPNAWLGGLKNIDLVREFGGGEGFWKALADGIEDIRVQDGKLLIQLAE